MLRNMSDEEESDNTRCHDKLALDFQNLTSH